MGPRSYILNRKSLLFLFLLVSFVLLLPATAFAQSVSRDAIVTAAVDKELPTVNITNPTASATVSGMVNAAADATDDGGITKVEFYIDGFLRITDVSAPYTFSWNTTNDGDGSHTIQAIAYDIINNTATDSITVTVANPTPPIAPTPPSKEEPEIKIPTPFRTILIDLPDIILVGPGAAASDFIFGFIIAGEIALILLFLFLIFKRRKRKKDEEEKEKQIPPPNKQIA